MAPLVASLFCIPAMYLLLARHANQIVTLILVTIFTVQLTVLGYPFYARPYGFALLMMILSIYFLEGWKENAKKIYLLGHVISITLALHFHYLSIFFLTSLIPFIVFTRNKPWHLALGWFCSLFTVLIWHEQLEMLFTNQEILSYQATATFLDLYKILLSAPSFHALMWLVLILYFSNLQLLIKLTKQIKFSSLVIAIAPLSLILIYGQISNTGLYINRYLGLFSISWFLVARDLTPTFTTSIKQLLIVLIVPIYSLIILNFPDNYQKL